MSIKKVLISILCGIILFLLVYLTGAFYNANFNISCWDENSRFAVSIFGFIATILGFILPNAEKI